MAKERLTKSAHISVTPREVDFVTRFGLNWQAFLDILGISRAIRKAPGTTLKQKKASVVLQAGNVGEGEDIPYSQANVVEIDRGTIGIEKYRKAVSIEAISDKGYDDAVAKTDEAFKNELISAVSGKFYECLNAGELTSIQTSLRAALAMAKGYVVNKFKKLNLTATEVVGFANVLDVYEFLGDTSINISVQTMFGFEYVQNFMGYKTLFLLDDSRIKRGRVIATPIENIVNYYISPADSEFAKAGLSYVTDGTTNLIGFHTEGAYGTAVSECFAIFGMDLFAEYVDGIAVVDVVASGSLGSLTVSSAEGTAVGDTKITVAEELGNGSHFAYKTAAGTAPTTTYLAELDSTWKAWDGTSDITATDNYKITIVEVNGSGQAIASGNTTVNSKN